jgi:ABC-2 type transport system ATP-binding protein
VIQLNELTKNFGAVRALDRCSLEVPEGSVFALLGPNGAGKTTAIRILLNILRPDHGTATTLGIDSQDLGPAELARLAFVSESRDLPDWMRVSEFFNYCRPFYPNRQPAELDHLVRLFGLPPDRKLRHLSRGMRMKAALAAALAYRHELLILDEPFSGLDVLVREQLMECIAERTPESTVLIATHDLSDIETFATHVAYLADGAIQFTGELDDISARFREIEATVGPAAPAQPLPANWLNLKQAPGLVRFTDAAFDETRSLAQLQQHWPGARDISVSPLSLRSIFIALARSQSQER